MKDWKACVAKNANKSFEYFSESKGIWIPFEDMEKSHLMNVIKKIIREDDQLPFRITYFDEETGKPIGGQYVSLIMEPSV